MDLDALIWLGYLHPSRENEKKGVTIRLDLQRFAAVLEHGLVRE